MQRCELLGLVVVPHQCELFSKTWYQEDNTGQTDLHKVPQRPFEKYLYTFQLCSSTIPVLNGTRAQGRGWLPHPLLTYMVISSRPPSPTVAASLMNCQGGPPPKYGHMHAYLHRHSNALENHCHCQMSRSLYGNISTALTEARKAKINSTKAINLVKIRAVCAAYLMSIAFSKNLEIWTAQLLDTASNHCSASTCCEHLQFLT